MPEKHRTAIFYPRDNDPQSVILYEELYKLGSHPLMIPFKLEHGEKSCVLEISQDNLIINENLNDVKAVYIRGLSTKTPLSAPPFLNEYELRAWQSKYIKDNIRISIVNSILNHLELKDALIINKIKSYLHHNTKVNFNLMLAKNGINVPITFGTNDIEMLKKKISEFESLIVKSPSGVGATRRVSPDFLLRNPLSLKMTPALFQEEIKSKTLRIHTVGSKAVLTLEIMAEDIDSRSDTGGFKVVELSKEQEKQVTKANKLLGWHFSAWDAIIDKNNKIYLLDGNPGPYIYWIGDQMTRLVMKELAKYMSVFSQTGNFKKADNAVNYPNVIHNQVLKFDENAFTYIENTINSWKIELGLRY